MPKETKTGVCKAKNPTICRYHGAKVIAPQIVDKFIQRYHPQGLTEEGKRRYIEETEELEIYIEPLLEAVATELEKNKRTKNYYKLDPNALAAAFFNRQAVPPRLLSYYNVDVFATREILKEANKSLPMPPEEKNELDPQLLSTNKGHKFLLAKALQEQGRPVAQVGSTYYGWSDEESQAHIRECGGISYVSNTEEDTWAEFAGTFADSDNYNHGLVGDGICKCGGWRGQLRYEGSVSEAIELAFKFFPKP